MRKFHTIVIHALKIYEDAPFTSKKTIRGQVENLMIMYQKLIDTPMSKKLIDIQHEMTYNFNNISADWTQETRLFSDSTQIYVSTSPVDISTTPIGLLSTS